MQSLRQSTATIKSNAAISPLYNSLHPGSSYAERIQVGETVHKEMETLKRAQDALRKAMLRLRKEILKTAVKEDKAFHLVDVQKLLMQNFHLFLKT